MEQSLRVAFFPDTYDEVDGVANTSRQFAAFAKRRGLPLLIVCGGSSNAEKSDGSVLRITRRRGPVGFPLDTKHDFDLLFWRHYTEVAKAVRAFAPDIVHLTGPSDVGQLGALVAHRLRIPLAASWHTNLHEYAEQRAMTHAGILGESTRRTVGRSIRTSSLAVILRFYKIAQLLFAPNPELADLLAKGTGKPVYPMERGVDVTLFGPERRDRTNNEFVIGYVGRLTVEKNIRLLAEIERALMDASFANFRFLIVGQGAEETWLCANMKKADFTGVLKGEALARAYANMDAFLFPSFTDTFGNVVLEALASGVPAIVTNRGGPQFIVSHGQTGFVAHDICDFARWIQYLACDRDLLQRMRRSARTNAVDASWDKIFEGLYAVYRCRLCDHPSPYPFRFASQSVAAAPRLG
jgi:glycosyltransferase involved in cell wall biosynthesis